MKSLKFILTLFAVMVFGSTSFAQTCNNVPVINSFEPNTGFIGSVVTIFGANFDANNLDNNVVYFGATKAEIISATFGKIEVVVPVGASTAPISVTNQCDLTAYSKVAFNGIFCPTPLDNQTYANRAFDLTGVYGAYNMLSQDLDLDGKPEVVSSNNGGGLTIAINNSTPGNLSFSAYNRNGGGQSIYAADFDGDGLKDLLSTYYVNRNTSTGPGHVSFANPIGIPRVSTYQIAAGDFNNDGKIDIVGEDGSTVWVAFNTSTGPGVISFGPRQSMGSVGTRCTGIQVADIDGDGKTDFIASQGPANRAVSIRNTTATGSMTPSFEAPEYWSSGGTYPYRSQLADFDKDGKIDFTSCNYQGATNTAIWRNISTVGNIEFAPTVNLPAPGANYRIGVGDVDGDGYPDIVTKSLGQNVFSVYRNSTSQAGTPTFEPRIDYFSSWQAEVSGIVIGDLDGDFVPDIATSGINSNRILFHRNGSTQEDTTAPTAICKNIVVALDPNGTVTITPDMVDNGSSDACGIDRIELSQTTFTCNDIGENQVILTVYDNAGNSTSCTATVNVQPAAIIVAGQTTVCAGETIPLTANIGDSYQWYLDGEAIVGATSRNYTASVTGSYTVEVTNAGGCSGTSVSTDLVINEGEPIEITGRTEAYCPGESLVASQSSLYQWYKDGVAVENATLQEFFPDGPGTYTVEVVDLFGCTASGSVTISPDTEAPTITLNGSAQMTVDSDTEFTDPLAMADDNCSTEIQVTSNLDMSTPGVYTITYKAIDGSGNESETISRQVTVLDATAPIVRAGRIVVELDENGKVTVDPASLDNGSTDNSNEELTFTLDRTTFDCEDLSGSGSGGGIPVDITYEGFRNQNNYSVGAGYNPNTNEFWYPHWSGSTINRVSPDGTFLGSFNSPHNIIMQIWMDTDSETEYYTSHWSSNYYAKTDINGQEIWRYTRSSGNYAGGITTDADYAYVLDYGASRIDVLDKYTGQYQRSINLPGNSYKYGSLVLANGHFYFGGDANGWGDLPHNWSAIHEVDMDGNYIGSISNPGPTYNAAFDGEVIWFSDFGSSNYGYRVSNGSAYGSGGVEVTLTGTDAAGNSASDVGIVVVVDNLAPSVSLNGDATMQVVIGDSFTDPGATASDNCSATVETTGNVDVNTAGTYVLSYKAVDGSGNESETITRTVEVIDLLVRTKDITVYLDANGAYTLDPSEVDDNSLLGGGSLSLDITSLDCSNLGSPVTVTLTATSSGGTSVSDTALVTVLDNSDPVAVVGSGLVFELGSDGTVSITPQDIDAGSSDNCGIVDWSVSSASFGCGDVGFHTVTLTVTDASGNTNSATTTVEIEDNIAPVISTQDATVQLDQNGYGSIELSDILLSASDVCGIASQTASQLSFDCSEVGENSVTVTVADNNGQITVNTVTVTVLDVLPIVAEADSFTLDTCGPITFTAAQLLGNDSDPYGETLKVDFVGQPSSGSIVDNGNGTFTYTPGQSTNHTATAEYIVKRDDGTVVFSGNGHFYEFVSAPGITWAQAKAAAEGRSYNGQAGYLVTITSAEENQFALSKLQGQGWIGASDNEVENEWMWVTGPEAGTYFYNQATGQAINGAYNNWSGGEPNDYKPLGGEDFAHFYTNGTWNDYPNSIGTAISGYVVEYGGSSEDCNIQSTTTGTITFELNDITPPTAIAQNITVELDPSGNASITTGMIDGGSNDACGIAGYSLSQYDFDCGDVGANTVTLTVTDVNNNVSSATATVTVRDVTAAEVITQDITIDLDANGNASITTDMINNGSNDACGIAGYALSQYDFDCSHVGTNTVTLTVTDVNNNVSLATATVTVRDITAAEVITQDITIDLDANGNASITTDMINNGSNDACGIAEYALSQYDFDCSHVGTNTVTLTVTDVNNNVSSATVTVTVRDVTAAEVITQDITIDLDANGNASITTDMINNGSNDACGIAGYALSQYDFDCSHVGANTVTLTVTDVNNNVSSAEATVTVRDVIAPTLTVPAAITVLNDPNVCGAVIDIGMATATDNCSIASIVSDGLDFYPVGTTTVTWTATDVNGNETSATQLITVTNDIPVINGFSMPESMLINSASMYSAGFTDNNLESATWDWGDGSTSAGTIDGQTVNGIHSYSATGLYTVTLTIVDACGESATEVYTYVPIYDPNEGHITGGGFITSLPGDLTTDISAEGKSNYGFQGKYLPNGRLQGNMNFHLNSAGFKFKSGSAQWMVIMDDNAIMKGVGTINDIGGYSYVATMVDIDVNNRAPNDRFRIKIYETSTGNVIYDNESGVALDVETLEQIDKGTVVIHRGGKGKADNSATTSTTGTGSDDSGTDDSSKGKGKKKAEVDTPVVGIEAFPNPTSSISTIRFSSNMDGKAMVGVFDMTGVQIATLYEGEVVADQNVEVEFNASRVASGVYLVRVNTNGYIRNLKLMVKK